jgi:hypothetical protein
MNYDLKQHLRETAEALMRADADQEAMEMELDLACQVTVNTRSYDLTNYFANRDRSEQTHLRFEPVNPRFAREIQHCVESACVG